MDTVQKVALGPPLHSPIATLIGWNGRSAPLTEARLAEVDFGSFDIQVSNVDDQDRHLKMSDFSSTRGRQFYRLKS
jgi:hypothetical protein